MPVLSGTDIRFVLYQPNCQTATVSQICASPRSLAALEIGQYWMEPNSSSQSCTSRWPRDPIQNHLVSQKWDWLALRLPKWFILICFFDAAVDHLIKCFSAEIGLMWCAFLWKLKIDNHDRSCPFPNLDFNDLGQNMISQLVLGIRERALVFPVTVSDIKEHKIPPAGNCSCWRKSSSTKSRDQVSGWWNTCSCHLEKKQAPSGQSPFTDSQQSEQVKKVI